MSIMINSVLLLAAAIPQTGDNFPKGILIAIVAIAIVAAIVTAVLSKKKNDDD